ncbi:HAD-IA family hydrolase [Shewanella sp. JM162201]|uniref:HAD-IA family hydrolase n=1 Tax=Shewanella jiangmenensis TaxID=2837387 RepID=A0ABS5V7Z1_9GAMM|nr:HAD-IA family hydrolase [Shewanella jiangmenensis]MBT1446556.1 HAD-IA family hydrolase [Shewanella jiangmenensis]
MQIFRRLKPIHAISFDLDDTLYDNRPIILAAEAAQLAFLHQQFPESRHWGTAEWRHHKLELMAKEPLLAHDPTRLRLATLRSGLKRLGLESDDANRGAGAVMDEFLYHRSNFAVPEASIKVLRALSSRFTLIGLTNGNVDADRIGLGELFAFVIKAGDGLKMKPHGDLFTLGCERLKVLPENLLHVGDSHKADVAGALRAGCMAALLNPAQGQALAAPLQSPLPHLCLPQLQSLLGLL